MSKQGMSDDPLPRLGSRKASSRPVSFRLSEKTITELRREAFRKGVDLSTLGREIVNYHNKWGKLSKGLRVIPVPRQLLKAALERLEEEQVEQLAYDSGKDAMTQMILYSKGSLTIEGFLEVFDLWLDASSINYRHEDGEGHTYVISHELGKKWSVFLAGLVKGVFEELGVRAEVKVEVRSGSVSFSLRGPHVY